MVPLFTATLWLSHYSNYHPLIHYSCHLVASQARQRSFPCLHSFLPNNVLLLHFQNKVLPPLLSPEMSWGGGGPNPRRNGIRPLPTSATSINSPPTFQWEAEKVEFPSSPPDESALSTFSCLGSSPFPCCGFIGMRLISETRFRIMCVSVRFHLDGNYADSCGLFPLSVPLSVETN